MGKYFSFLVLVFITSAHQGFADDNFCTKCKVMREYHEKHPCKYTYYEDYLNDVKENGADATKPKDEDLSPEVKRIMNASSEAPKAAK